MPQYLDDEAFPFTADELRRALMLQMPAEHADDFVAQFAALVADSEASHRIAAEARAGGSTDPAEVNPVSWATDADLLAMMWCLPECSGRADELVARQMQKAEDGQIQLITALRRERIVGSPPADVVREARRRVARKRAGWTRRKRAMADRLGVPRPDGSVRG